MRRSTPAVPALVLALAPLACAPPDPAPPADPCARSFDDVAEGHELFRFEGTDPFVSVHLERAFEESGVGESSLYVLRSFALSEGDACLETSVEAALAYENSHHNWADRATAEIDGVRYTLALDFVLDVEDSGWRATLSGEDASTGEVVLEARELSVTGAPLSCWACPGFLPVWITEVLPENAGGHTDEAGDADPWLELWNPSGDAVSLEGYSLELSGGSAATWTFPAGTTIGRHEHLIVWLDGEPEDGASGEGALHTSFRLPPTGGQVLLRDATGVTVGERAFSSPGAGQSLDLDIYARRYVATGTPTPGATSSLQE